LQYCEKKAQYEIGYCSIARRNLKVRFVVAMLQKASNFEMGHCYNARPENYSKIGSCSGATMHLLGMLRRRIEQDGRRGLRKDVSVLQVIIYAVRFGLAILQ